MTSQIIYKGQLRTEATHLQSNSTIETDAPVDNHGKGERFSPTDIVATALGSCMLSIMGIKAAGMGIDDKLVGTRLEISKIMASEPRRISGIHVNFYFPLNTQFEEREQIILQNAAITCPVAKSIHPEIDMQVKFNWGT